MSDSTTRPHRDTVMMALTIDQIAKLAGISRSRLRHWETTGAFQPTYDEKLSPGPFRRIYIFQDLVTLCAIVRLRVEFGIGLGELRGVTTYLRDHWDSPWSRLAVRVYGKHLVFRDPETGQWMSADPVGQLTFELAFEDVRNESERHVRQQMRRTVEQHGEITRNRYVMSNRWVFAGTRIPVETVLEYLHEGYSRNKILAEYPSLVDANIDAALAFEERRSATA